MILSHNSNNLHLDSKSINHYIPQILGCLQSLYLFLQKIITSFSLFCIKSSISISTLHHQHYCMWEFLHVAAAPSSTKLIRIIPCSDTNLLRTAKVCKLQRNKTNIHNTNIYVVHPLNIWLHLRACHFSLSSINKSSLQAHSKYIS